MWSKFCSCKLSNFIKAVREKIFDTYIVTVNNNLTMISMKNVQKAETISHYEKKTVLKKSKKS
jgi:hypothetical protein